MTQWLCTVCGYVHEGDEPCDYCPICGAATELFEEIAAPVAPPPVVAPTRWRCINCDYIHEGAEPPQVCVVCGAGTDQFEAVTQEQKTSEAGQFNGTIVIIGGGIAGLSAAEAARSTSAQARIVLLTREAELPYYRLNLTRYLAGEIAPDELPVHPGIWYQEKNIEVRFNTEVTAIDVNAKQLRIKDGDALSYDRLILAMGAHPFVPPVAGINRQNVVTLRHKKDADWILGNCKAGTRCVVVGGGVLGLEIAAALVRQQVSVSLIEGFGWLLPRQLNQQASDYLETSVKELGIELVLGARIKQFDGDESVRTVVLETGENIAADMVVVAAGVRTNSYLARLAGLEVKEGVVVDHQLRTAHEDIFAAGDLAEHQSVCYGTWAPAQYQGRIAGINAAGGDVSFGGIPRSNILKVLGVDMLSIGNVHPDDASYRTFEQADAEHYAEVIFRDDRLVGAILVGDTSKSPLIKKLIESRQSCHDLLKNSQSGEDIFRGLSV